jgi:hypothetical protein
LFRIADSVMLPLNLSLEQASALVEAFLRFPVQGTTTWGWSFYRSDRLAGHVVLVVAPPVLMVTFTASSIGSLKGTSIRSSPCS